MYRFFKNSPGTSGNYSPNCQTREKLKPGGFIAFASDIADYFKETKNLVSQDFTFINKDDLTPHENYVVTKYHQKAITEGRVPQFFKAILGATGKHTTSAVF